MNLVKYDAACRAIAEAKSVDEVKMIRDKAQAIAAAARIAKNHGMEIDAAEIRIRAERRLGEMIGEQARTVGLNEGGRPRKTGSSSAPVSNNPTLASAGIDKKLSARSQAIAAISEDDFEATLAEHREAQQAVTSRTMEKLMLRKQKTEQHSANLSQPADVSESGPYQLIFADPPWMYDHQETPNRDIENQYPTEDVETIKSHIPNTEPNAILFLWATAPKLAEAMQVLTAWGFRYVTNAVWDKQKIGMGYWFRGQHELLLVGVKGSPGTVPECERRSSVFAETRTTHSKKPECVYEWIERAFPEKTKLEMYSRKPRFGWASWGNEA
jgi:N6-adenosine-specific RNA methylase IME4